MSYDEAIARLREAAVAACRSGSLDARRSLLVQAGQFEQGVRDLGLPVPVEDVTDAASRGFLGRASPRSVLDALDALPAWAASLTIKEPEGFAFYTLYPEAYVSAARQWLSEHPDAGRVLVVGLRSIGTTLSAVVAEVVGARRVTVRPSGHPFAREADLDTRGAEWVLVVDEGPGLSGSSMAAVAAAAHRCGVPADRIAFFPGHGGEPGREANDEVRRWWSSTRRYVGSVGGLDLALASETTRLTGIPVVAVEDASAGRWRSFAYADGGPLPPVAATFERTKRLVRLQNGAAVLWKFAGLTHTADADYERQCELASKGWTPAPIGRHWGFVGTPWIEGRRMLSGGADPERLGRYIKDAARPPLSATEAEEAIGRLREMMTVNLGIEPPTIQPRVDLPSYADGRMGPHEWLANGMKTDVVGHDHDHTVIGRQSILWDLAGAALEWDLSESQVDRMVRTASVVVGAEEIAFYVAGYRAFQAGIRHYNGDC